MESAKKQKTKDDRIELRNSSFSGVFWGWGTQSISKVRTVAVNHFSILPYLRAILHWKLVYKTHEKSIFLALTFLFG